jgi:hypothetical protein
VAVGELATRDFIRGELSRLAPGDGDGDERKKDRKDKPRRRDPVA